MNGGIRIIGSNFRKDLDQCQFKSSRPIKGQPCQPEKVSMSNTNIRFQIKQTFQFQPKATTEQKSKGTIAMTKAKIVFTILIATSSSTNAQEPCRSYYQLGETIPSHCRDQLRTGTRTLERWGEGGPVAIPNPNSTPLATDFGLLKPPLVTSPFSRRY